MILAWASPFNVISIGRSHHKIQKFEQYNTYISIRAWSYYAVTPLKPLKFCFQCNLKYIQSKVGKQI